MDLHPSTLRGTVYRANGYIRRASVSEARSWSPQNGQRRFKETRVASNSGMPLVLWTPTDGSRSSTRSANAAIPATPRSPGTVSGCGTDRMKDPALAKPFWKRGRANGES
jgi:hypothetical protein